MKKMNEKGQSLTEFALVLPLVLMLMFAVLTFGFLIYDRIVVVYATTQAADRGGEVIDRTTMTFEEKDAEIRRVADTYLSYQMFGDNQHVSINYDSEKIEVKTTMTYTFVLPLVDELLNGALDVPIEYTAIYRIEK